MTRTIADYRPQHDDECDAVRCGACGYGIVCLHGNRCTCGLDAQHIAAVRAEADAQHQEQIARWRDQYEYADRLRRDGNEQIARLTAQVAALTQERNAERGRAETAEARAEQAEAALVTTPQSRAAVLSDFDTRLRAKLTPVLNTDIAMEMLILVADVLREMRAEPAAITASPRRPCGCAEPVGARHGAPCGWPGPNPHDASRQTPETP